SELCSRLHELSEEALDIQRDLTLERRRMHRVPEDFDSGQIEWFRASMEESVRERPDGWRIVYLHHPLYSTIANHCERPDILGVRANLLQMLRQAHLVLSGHSHAFESFRSKDLPYTALVVTGGGGQVTL